MCVTEWAPNQLERTQSHDERGGIPDEREWTPNDSTERCRSMSEYIVYGKLCNIMLSLFQF